MSWSLNITNDIIQNKQISFLGGKPCIPRGYTVPKCKLCGNEQCFYYQIALPTGMFWADKTIALFCCTSCMDESFIVPQMLKTILHQADIPGEFLSNYQRNFEFLVFETNNGFLMESYQEKVKFRAIELIESNELGNFGMLGGTPQWMSENESPASYDGDIPMHFLMQLCSGIEFHVHEAAPPQVELNIMGEQSPSPFDFYSLFLGNALYLFGTEYGDPLVYAITQVD
ncbi:hypothetical protein KS4_01170 [Poriferisphaera corsica]|uniref:DUF1963 domain-containing protein n=1 Tax=Poriferisphaera corsica TaxID=2528020 RepID=A0A517YPD6_9BACT|nr:hypothetical protein [Poriferisphaera corsica]QDU32088.1 hypothetical protein KS4_01170 [Poriferisphaera corsica]